MLRAVHETRGSRPEELPLRWLGGGGKSAAIVYTLIETAKLNRVDPQVWLTDILGRIADHKITRINDLLPWRYAAAAA